LFTIILGSGPAAAQDRPIAVKEEIKWSEAVNGVRARIFLKRTAIVNDTPIVSTYLVLQNVSDVLNPIRFTWGSEQTRFRVVDAEGRELPPANGPYSGRGSVGPFPLVLPFGGELTFDISCRGHGVGGPLAAHIDLGPTWQIKPDQGDSFLRATIEIEKIPPIRNDFMREWHGRIELPPVKIPTQPDPIDPATIDARIKELGEQMLGKNGQQSEEAVRALSLIDDPRVILWYCKAMDTNSYSLKMAALDRLARLDGEEAFAGIKKGARTMASDIGNTRTGQDAAQLAGGVRHRAALALVRSVHADANRVLFDMWDDPYVGVRLTVAQELGKMNTTESLALLKKMTGDPDERVRGEAERYLKEKAEK
jgi:hypothetical protein